MTHVRVPILAALTLVLATAAPARAQREMFLDALRAFAAAPPQTPGAGERRNATDRMHAALVAWDRAVAALEERVRRESAGATTAQAYRLHAQLGLAYRTRGRLDDALREFDVAAALQPSSSDLQVLRALTLEAAGRADEAVAAFRQAWELDPHSTVKAYYVAQRASGPDQARAQAALIAAYEHLPARAATSTEPFPVIDAIPDTLSPTPTAADDASAEGFMLLRTGRFEDAVTSLSRANLGVAAASADSAAAHIARGHRAEAESRVTDARREYEAALPGVLAGRAALYVGLGRLAQVDGDPAGAIDAFTRAARLAPNEANVHKELALALESQGRIADALCETMAALLIDPRDAQAHAMVGQLHLDAGRDSDAVPPLVRALTLDPGRYETHYALATAFRRLGRTDDAARELELFERARTAALEQRRRQIGHDVDQEEAIRRGQAPAGAK